MSSNQNKLSQFWQELKRRKVVRVITVYAAAAFVILELVSIIVEPLKLPEWFLPMVIVLLCIGFIIAIILSWIYDIHPEGGIVKTEPARKVKEDDKPVTSNSWKIASYISFVVIVGLIILNIIPRANNKKILEKSIAVLPLEYLSEDPNKQYLANGVLDAITGHLSMIEGLRVMPRTSVEQYRENKKSAKEIGEELDVSYLIEGSFLMIEDQVKLTIQLVVAEEGDHLFFKEYDRNYKDILVVQSEVAQTIAKEIEVAITPEEKELIEKIPTTSLTALDFYQRGREEYWSSLLNREYWSRLEKAEYFFNKALEYDPDYASAYAGLAMVYYSRYFTTTTSGDQYSADYYVSKNLDTMNLLAKKALLLDDQIADVYFAKGMYEQESGNLDESLGFFEQALNINPNHTMALTGVASTYRYLYDYVNGIKLIHEAERLERGAVLPIIYIDLQGAYLNMGFYEKSLQYLNHFLSITGDSITYYLMRYVVEFLLGNQEDANKFAKSAFDIDSTSTDAILYMGRAFLDSKRYEEAYSYYSRYFSQLETTGNLDVNDMNRMGHTLWMVGQRDEARYYFSQMIEHCRRHIEMNSSYSRTGATFDIAGVYAFLGEKDSAYFYLEELTRTNWQVSYSLEMLNGLDPLFESIRQEERFQQL
ncbi:MAG: hypothetical protein KAR16_09330, partial [Bacteroidales bacterium]|nr:hypothetical protein [Bacteroidales bacterium]